MPPLYDGLYPLTLRMKMKPSSLELFFDRYFATDMQKSNWEIQKLDFFVSYCIMGSADIWPTLVSQTHVLTFIFDCFSKVLETLITLEQKNYVLMLVCLM